MTDGIIWDDEAPATSVAPSGGTGIVWDDEAPKESPQIPPTVGYPAAAVVGAARNVPYAADLGSVVNAAKTYVGMHPTGVPTEGPFGERRAVAKQQIERAQKTLGEQYPGTALAGQVAGAVAMPSVASGVKAATPAARALLTAGEQAGLGALYGSEEGGGQGALTGATIGGLAGGVLGRFAPSGKPSTMSDIVQAGERQGVAVPYMAATDSLLPKLAGAGADISPLGGWIMGKRAEDAIGKLGAATDRLAGQPRSTSAIGEGARISIADWVQHGSSKEAERLYNAVDKLVDPAIKTPTSQSLTAVQDIVARRAAARLPTESPSIKLLSDAVTDPQGLSYSGIKDLRTYLGGMLKNPSIIPGDVQRGEIKQLYEALSKDLRGAVSNAGGPQAAAAFDRANSRYSEIVGQRSQLARIIGKDAQKTGESVYGVLTGMATTGTKADVRRLDLARRTMSPAAWSDLTSGVVSNLGRDVQGAFSPARFVTGYAKLSDAGKDALFGPANNPLRSSLEDISKLSAAFDRPSKFRNVSKTATTGAGLASLYGMFVDPFTTLGANLTAGAMGALMSHSMTARSLANLQRAQLIAHRAGTAATRIGVQTAARQLAAHAKQYVDVDIPVEAPEPPQRQQRAAGGRIESRDYPAKKMSSLEKAARRAHLDIAKELEPVMGMHDDVVADALGLAKGV